MIRRIGSLEVKMVWWVRVLLVLITYHLSPVTSFAQDSTRVFTEQHPLVYEDARDLWPYAFLNEKGEPVGYNIDLLRLL